MKVIRFFAAFLLLLALISAVPFVGIPVYKFQGGKPFAGEFIYNPYEGIDSTAWRKANFHAHQREKPACDYTVDEFIEAYQKSGYDIIGLTDHQEINMERSDRQGFIPGYEHGFGINKHHHCLLGAGKVWRFDLPLIITQSQAQFMVHKLRPQGKALFLNHPGELRFVNHGLYSRLRGYDLFELNPERSPEINSPHLWDMALSHGIYSNQVSDDDAHTITKRGRWFQRSFTMINTQTYDPDDIIANLKKGRSYGVYVPRELNLSFDHHPEFPRVSDISFKDSLITVKLSHPAVSVRFIGQGGRTLAEYSDTIGGAMGDPLGISQASYKFLPEDTYVRAEITYANGLMMFLNPFVRTPDGNAPENIFNAEVDVPLTMFSAVAWSIVVILLAFFIYLLLRRRKRRRPDYSRLYKDIRPLWYSGNS